MAGGGDCLLNATFSPCLHPSLSWLVRHCALGKLPYVTLYVYRYCIVLPGIWKPSVAEYFSVSQPGHDRDQWELRVVHTNTFPSLCLVVREAGHLTRLLHSAVPFQWPLQLQAEKGKDQRDGLQWRLELFWFTWAYSYLHVIQKLAYHNWSRNCGQC